MPKFKCIQHISHRTIIIFLCTAAFIHNVVMNGAMNVIISSLQKEFYLTSKETGIYVSVYDIGSLLSSIFVPIMGSRGSKPRWIAFGMCMLCLGCFINVTPHFLKPRSPLSSSLNQTDFDFNDDIDENRYELCDEMKITQKNHSNIKIDSLCSKFSLKNADDASSFRFNNLKYVLYAANIINGLSSSSMTTLAFSYIEDIAPPNMATTYESIYYATGALGMGIGFMITSQFLNIYSDFDRSNSIPVWMKPEHPNWIGAWWLPFIIFGFIAIILAIVIAIFPRNIKYKEKKIFKDTLVRNGETVHLNGNIIEENEDLQTDEKSKLNGHVLDSVVVVNENHERHNDECSSLTQSGEDNYDGYESTGKSDATTSEGFKVNYTANGSDKLQIDRVTTTTILSNNKHATLNSNEHEHENAHNNTFLNTVKETGSMLSINNRGVFFSSEALNDHNNNNTSNTNHKPEVRVRTKQKITHMLKCSIKLLKQPTFVCILIAAAIEGLLQNSFLAFASLFMEYQYRLASASASFSLGALSIPPLIIGSLLSGLIINKYKWKMKEFLVFLSILLFFNMFVYCGFLISCKEPNFIFNQDYISNKFDHGLNTKQTRVQRHVNEIKYECYEQTSNSTFCDCNENIYKPVCLRNSYDIVFESACIAGCKTYNKETSQFLNCPYAQCMSDRLLPGTSQNTLTLDNGLCEMPYSCKLKLYVVYATVFLIMFITAFSYIPYMKVTIGCVESNPEMNAIALGIKQLAMTGIGTIPGPIIFGSVIDLSCKYWHIDCLNQSVCKVYDNKKFAMSFGYLGIGFKFICWISIVLSLVFLKTQRRKK